MDDHFSQKKPQELIIIMGMHRSGTSALTRVLNLAGLGLLPQDLLEPNQDNPLGFWEPKNIVKTNNQLLQQFDRHWADPKPMHEGWHEMFLDPNNTAGMRATLQKETAHTVGTNSRVVIKDPRFSRVLPAWLTVLQQFGADAVCMIACRNPLDVYGSLKARDRFEVSHALELWLCYMLEAESVSRGMRRVFVHYDELLTNWPKTLQSITDATQLSGEDVSDHMKRQIDNFLRKDLRHHHAAISDLDENIPLHAMVKATYDLCLHANDRDQADAFDALDKQRRIRWSERSPGESGSGIIHQMPTWYVEKSWEYAAKGDDSKALSAVDTAIDMASDVARFHFIRGNILVRLGELETALEARRTAVQLDNKVPRFHRLFCDSLNQLGLHDEAADAIGLLASLEPRAATHHKHGIWLARVGRLTEASVAQRKAISSDNSQCRYYNALANALNGLGKTEEASEALLAAIKLSPPNANLCDHLGHLFTKLNKWPDATSMHDKAVDLRCQLLSFRKKTVLSSAAENKENNKSQLLRLLARLGARHWAEDLALRTKNSEAAHIDQEKAWPLGFSIQARPVVPIMECDNNRDETAPLLSIMIPVYEVNNEQWLEKCLESVLSQDQGPVWAEIVIVDDASPNHTAEKIANKHAPRVRYIQNHQNLGLVGNHNKCISLAKGTFVHILHQDDYVEPGFYKALLNPMLDDESLVAGFTHNRFPNAEGNFSSKTDPPRPPTGVLENWHIRLSHELRIQFPSIIVRRSSYQKVGGFFSGRKFSFDWDLWNRVAALGPVWYDRRPLAQYRVHELSATYSFTMKDRVVDAMQTVASMLQLLPCKLHRSTAEMGMYKFFLRYWGLVTKSPIGTVTLEQSELVDFLLSGWTNDQERLYILKLLHGLTT